MIMIAHCCAGDCRGGPLSDSSAPALTQPCNVLTVILHGCGGTWEYVQSGEGRSYIRHGKCGVQEGFLAKVTNTVLAP